MINQKFNAWIVDCHSCFPTTVTKDQHGECSSVIAIGEYGESLVYFTKESSTNHTFCEKTEG